MREAGVIGRGLRRNDRGGPILVGDAEPAAGRLVERNWGFLDLGILGLVKALLAEHADEAFVQHVDGGRCRLVVAGDAAIAGKRHGIGAAIRHLVGNGEHVAVVDGDGAGEGDALFIGIGQRHRRGFGELGAFGRSPYGGRARQRAGIGVRNIADFGEIAVMRVGRIEQRDDRAVRLYGLAIGLELQVVETRAGQVDRADDRLGVDGKARRLGQRFLARGSCLRLGLAGQGA